MNLPTIRQLQYLIAVIELRHFGQAAARCFVTQSTLSAGIQELESLLGTTLIERSKRHVIPTPLGMVLTEKAQEIIKLASTIVTLSAGADSTPLTGHLKLGVIPTIGPFLLPQVLPGIRHHFPALELYLVEDQTERLIKRLIAGEIDTAILALPYDIGNLESTTFWEENLWLALPKNHALASHKPIASSQLPKEGLLLLEDGHCFKDHTLAACHLKDSKTRTLFHGTSLYTLMQMVVGGQGITLIPEMALHANMLGSNEVTVRPLAEKGPHRKIALVWRKSYHKKEDLHLLAEKMATNLHQHKMATPLGQRKT